MAVDPSTARRSPEPGSAGPPRSVWAEGRSVASPSSTPSAPPTEPGEAGAAAVLGHEFHGFAPLDQVHAGAGREGHRPLQARARTVPAVRGGPPVEQHGDAAAPRPLLEPDHQLVVAGRAAPVHAPQLVAAAVGPHEHVRAALTGARRARAVGPVARAERVRDPVQRHGPGQHQQPFRARDRAGELGQAERVRAVRDERADPVHAPADRAQGVVHGRVHAPRARRDQEPRWGRGPHGVRRGVDQLQRTDRRPSGDLQRDRRRCADGEPVRRERPLHAHRPPGGQGEQQREQGEYGGEGADPQQVALLERDRARGGGDPGGEQAAAAGAQDGAVGPAGDRTEGGAAVGRVAVVARRRCRGEVRRIRSHGPLRTGPAPGPAGG